MKVQRNETVNFLDYGKVMKITSDGSKRNASVTVTDAESTPSCITSIQHGKRDFASAINRSSTSSAPAVKPCRFITLLSLWMIVCLLFGVTTTTSLPLETEDVDALRNINAPKVAVLSTDVELVARHDALNPRAGDPFEIEEVVTALYGNLGAYFAGKVPNSTTPREFPLEKGMFCLINGALFKTPWIFIDTCPEIVSLAFVETGPGMVIGMLAGQMICAYLLNLMLDKLAPAVMTKTCDSVMEVAGDWFGEQKAQEIFKPYIDSDFRFYSLDNDASNCGQVGQKCPEGSSCVGSACTSPTCSDPSSAGSACGTQGSNCACATDDTLTGYCVQDVQSCRDIIGLSPDAFQRTLDCPSGYVCASSERCGRKLCLNAETCLGSGGFDDVKFGLPLDFPPTVVPGSSPKSGWEMSFDSLDNYLATDFSLPEDWYLVYDSKRSQH
ncbi:hypothetical protein BGZ60DRAFT_514474 [Tricladium varicosporioides]|nr:hypothetical protein BGZ60DRAFT_514474 [Hymenoscyphus varicosporioides]